MTWSFEASCVDAGLHFNADERHRVSVDDVPVETGRIAEARGGHVINSGQIYKEHLHFGDSRDDGGRAC
jgi:hypothetical protein